VGTRLTAQKSLNRKRTRQRTEKKRILMGATDVARAPLRSWRTKENEKWSCSISGTPRKVDDREILRGLELTVHEGESMPSGTKRSGKSTLAPHVLFGKPGTK